MGYDELSRANFIPDLTDKVLPSVSIRTSRLAVTDVGASAPMSLVPMFCRSLKVKAERTNSGIVYVGSDVSIDLRVNGYPLGPGEELVLEVNDVSIVHYQGDTLNDGIRIIHGS